MARQKKAAPVSNVKHNAKAPCSQEFNIIGKSGVKKKTWWNGYRSPAQRAADA
jgi:hypothetical protein